MKIYRIELVMPNDFDPYAAKWNTGGGMNMHLVLIDTIASIEPTFKKRIKSTSEWIDTETKDYV